MASLIRLDDVPHQVSGELEGLGKRERLGRERQAYGMAAAELVRQARTENKVRTALSMASRWPLTTPDCLPHQVRAALFERIVDLIAC
jgi:hypothetical protein